RQSLRDVNTSRSSGVLGAVGETCDGEKDAGRARPRWGLPVAQVGRQVEERAVPRHAVTPARRRADGAPLLLQGSIGRRSDLGGAGDQKLHGTATWRYATSSFLAVLPTAAAICSGASP